jgi:hypothetical protein
MTDRDILMLEGGALIGLLTGLFVFWAIAATLTHHLAFWRDAYCAAEVTPPSFCIEGADND